MTIRDHDKRPYLRERAAALLKIGSGMSAHHVARHGLLKPRDPDSVYQWLNDFIGTGRLKPRPHVAGLFPPADPAREAVADRLSQPVGDDGPDCWTLALAREHCPELSGLQTISGVIRRLRRWRISWKCGRIHLISPDPQYESKVAAIRAIRAAALDDPERLRVLFADEASFYRLPHAGRTWHCEGGGGGAQPTAVHTAGSNTRRRIVATLDVQDGRVLFQTGSMIGIKALRAFLRRIRRHYGDELRLVIVWDNWPLHYHPEILRVAGEERIELLYTPTYAPWTNPIEKLWKKLRHDVLRLHHCSGEWKKLRARVDGYLAKLRGANPALLRYVGLLPA
ncbi:MAG TPA: IS630 family transposase [Longimicrobium sp.]